MTDRQFNRTLKATRAEARQLLAESVGGSMPKHYIVTFRQILTYMVIILGGGVVGAFLGAMVR